MLLRVCVVWERGGCSVSGCGGFGGEGQEDMARMYVHARIPRREGRNNGVGAACPWRSHQRGRERSWS